jgi:hypothetical protein
MIFETASEAKEALAESEGDFIRYSILQLAPFSIFSVIYSANVFLTSPSPSILK